MESILEKSTPVLNKETPKKYLLNLKVNGYTYIEETNNLEEAIMSHKPFSVKTNVIIHIESEKGVCDKILVGARGRVLFNKKGYLGVFINNLIFKPYATQ